MMRKEELFEKLVKEELPKLRSGVLSILKNDREIEDVIQESLMTAYEHFDSFKNESALVSWVYRITVNKAYDILRERKRRSSAEEEFVLEREVGNEDEENWHLHCLKGAVAELPEAYQEVIVQLYKNGLSMPEVAQQLGITENALYQRVFRAKMMLRTAIIKQSQLDEDSEEVLQITRRKWMGPGD